MMKPTIHLNGTARADLHSGFYTALDKLEEAESALSRCYPNGRDYYPQGNTACSQAMREHDARLRAVRSIISEIEALAEHTMGG
jgi:hypothetical protein